MKQNERTYADNVPLSPIAPVPQLKTSPSDRVDTPLTQNRTDRAICPGRGRVLPLASTRASHLGEWPRRFAGGARSATRTSELPSACRSGTDAVQPYIRVRFVHQRVELLHRLPYPYERISDVTKIESDIVYLPMRARTVFLKFSRILMLKSTVCFS